jgi:Zn-dependent peptidase ImmA (M78 family)
MSWQVANRIASVAAAQAHGDLDVDPADTPIQVSTAIDRAGLRLMWQELTGLFGVYVADGGGVLINEKLTHAARRHTAAHELGHHRLQHPTTQDPDSDGGDPLGLAAAEHRRQPNERAAEAFAAWFLMPRRGVRATLAGLGLSEVHTAMQAYQLSLHLGTAYAATVRQLVSLRLIGQMTGRRWGDIAPSRFKRALAGDLIDSTRDADVWHLGRGTERTLYTSPGDLLVIPHDDEVRNATGSLGTAGRTEDGGTVLRCEKPEEGQIDTAFIETGRAMITVVTEPRPHGIYHRSPASPTATGISL